MSSLSNTPSLEKRFYRIGTLGIMTETPAFPEPSCFSPFRTDEQIADLSVSVIPVGSVPQEPEIAGRTGWITVGNKIYLTEGQDRQITVKAEYDGYGHTRVLLDENRQGILGPAFMLRMLCLPNRFLERGSLFLHASYIEKDGEAILFTAKSQVGKSTQAALWEKYRGYCVVNGDRTLIREEGGRWLACGSPYCGTSKICMNRTVPIRAVVILSQAKINTARRAGGGEALKALLMGCTYDPLSQRDVKAVTGIAERLIADVPFYTLACTPDVHAIEELEQVL